MEKKSLYIGIAMMCLWWVPIAPVMIILGIYGIIISREPYQEKADLALVLNITGMILTFLNFFLGNLIMVLFVILFG